MLQSSSQRRSRLPRLLQDVQYRQQRDDLALGGGKFYDGLGSYNIERCAVTDCPSRLGGIIVAIVTGPQRAGNGRVSFAVAAFLTATFPQGIDRVRSTPHEVGIVMAMLEGKRPASGWALHIMWGVSTAPANVPASMQAYHFRTRGF